MSAMGIGFLEVNTITAYDALPIVGAKITVLSGDEVLYELTTDESGLTEKVALEAPAVALTLDPNFDGVPYSVCDVRAEATGYVTVTIHDIQILDTEVSILPIHMEPALTPSDPIDLWTPPHHLIWDDDRKMDIPPTRTTPDTPRVLSEVIIPEFITVHLGRPDQAARNVRVPFTEYIKNSASHEIFSTWPEASLEANIYCIISLTLNRIFTNIHR